MKVIFDHQIFSYQKYGGASKYFCELLANMPREVWDTTTLLSNNEYVKQLELFKVNHFFPNKWFRGQGYIMNILNKPYSTYRLLKKDYDVFHQTHFETYCLKAIGNKPMVMTFHDMNFSTYFRNDAMVAIQKKSIKRADKIIAISENTKKDLVEMWNIDPDKISVIYHGIDKREYENLPLGRIVDKPYILNVGMRPEYKNFKRLVQSFSLLNKSYPDLMLICTSLPFSVEELGLFREYNISNNVRHFSATETQLGQLYRDAEIFVFPSVYEGFGMPLLEAMVNSCPVVLSSASCFPEIAGEAGRYFNPYDVEDMYIAMKTVLESTGLRAELVKKGLERVNLFSWEKTAEQHLEVYNSLI
ncbi:glycosyltransferase family 4 protein [Viscerimonas tarda]